MKIEWTTTEQPAPVPKTWRLFKRYEADCTLRELEPGDMVSVLKAIDPEPRAAILALVVPSVPVALQHVIQRPRGWVNKEELDEARRENAALQAQLTRERDVARGERRSGAPSPPGVATVGWLRFQSAHSAAEDRVELTATDAGLRETLGAFEVAQVYPDLGGTPVFKIEVRKRSARHY